MNNKPGYILIIVQSVIIALLLLYLVFLPGNQDGITTPDNRVSELERQIAICAERNDSLAVLIQEVSITGAVPPFLDQNQLENLANKGLSDPVSDIRQDLVKRSGLIDMESVHGGKMGFYFHDGIHILNEKWVFAYFEDGHMAGALLLKYEINEDGSLGWEVLDETHY
jgi:hypothetical protein